MPSIERRRATLAVQASLAMGLVALISVLAAGAVALPLVGRAAEDQARRQLSASADLVAGTADQQGELGRPAGLAKLRQLLARQQVDLLVLRPKVAAALAPADLAAVLAGHDVSGTRTIAGRRVLLEARPTAANTGVALLQPLSAVSTPRHQVVHRTLVALVIGLAGGALAGFVLAWRLARPLRRAAAAAQELAAGHREVRVEPAGPVEVAAVAEAINDLAAALSASELQQREFLLSISHELRTPLTAVRGYAEAFADGVVPAERSAATGSVMLAEAERLTRLVEDLLDLARLRAATFPVELMDSDVVAIVDQAAVVWRDRATPTGVRLLVEHGRRTLPAHTDPLRVRQIIDGLAENALRVLEPGGVLVFATRVEDGRAVMEIRDSGPGLTDADIAIAFERSALHDRYRGERRVGAGIGLALVDGLVTRLGGTVAAGHAAEGGAAFTIRLPAARPPTLT
jgi:two-component system sensor histidine kinase BaeS